MKICIVFNNLQYSDGVARAAIDIANILNKQGYNITLIPIYKLEKEILKEIENGIRVKKIFGFYFRGLSGILGKIPIKYLYRKIIGNKYDIEIAFQIGMATKLIASSENQNAYHIGWMHGYDYDLLFKKCYLKMDKMICVSKCNAQKLQKDLEGKVDVDYCYNPINDIAVVEKGKALIDQPTNNQLIFVSVGRHSKEKGYERLLRCASQLKSEGYIFQLWLIGDGPEHLNLSEKVNEMKINDCVTLFRAKSNPHAYTAKCDVFVCSSYSEGYSSACVEAVMLNVPVISTNVSGAHEIIGLAQAGMVVGMEDKDIYEGMKYVLDNPNTIDNWKHVLTTTKHQFSYEDRKNRLLRIIKGAEYKHK